MNAIEAAVALKALDQDATLQQVLELAGSHPPYHAVIYSALVEAGFPLGEVYDTFLCTPVDERRQLMDKVIYILQQQQL